MRVDHGVERGGLLANRGYGTHIHTRRARVSDIAVYALLCLCIRVEYYTSHGKACAVAGSIPIFMSSVFRSIDLSQMGWRVLHSR